MACLTNPLLQVRGLRKYFRIGRGASEVVRAVDGVDLDIHEGTTLGIVGESGCGKSTLALCVLHLLRPTAGTVLFAGTDVARFERNGNRQFRREAQIIFQDPYGSLDPRMSIAQIVAEPLRIHRQCRGTPLEKRVAAMLAWVGLREELLERRPAELSGGQQQRVAIARALSLEPKLLVCDEPTRALDLLVQAQVLNLLRQLQTELGIAYLYISHDVRVVQTMADTVAVMERGKIVEMGASEAVLERPQHPCTQALVNATTSREASRRDT